jgi:hypothetical protein
VTAAFDPKKDAESQETRCSLAEGDGVLSGPLAVTIEDKSVRENNDL